MGSSTRLPASGVGEGGASGYCVPVEESPMVRVGTDECDSYLDRTNSKRPPEQPSAEEHEECARGDKPCSIRECNADDDCAGAGGVGATAGAGSNASPNRSACKTGSATLYISLISGCVAPTEAGGGGPEAFIVLDPTPKAEECER